jgi:hypothetical protein
MVAWGSEEDVGGASIGRKTHFIYTSMLYLLLSNNLTCCHSKLPRPLTYSLVNTDNVNASFPQWFPPLFPWNVHSARVVASSQRSQSTSPSPTTRYSLIASPLSSLLLSTTYPPTFNSLACQNRATLMGHDQIASLRERLRSLLAHSRDLQRKQGATNAVSGTLQQWGKDFQRFLAGTILALTRMVSLGEGPLVASI